MKNNKKTIFFLGLVFVFISTILGLGKLKSFFAEKKDVFLKQKPAVISSNSFFYDKELFLNATNNPNFLKNYQMITLKEKIRAGIIPHHLLASNLIAEFFLNLSKQETIKTVILIGPNHDEKGDWDVYTTQSIFDTSFGEVEFDYSLSQELTNQNLVGMDKEEIFKNEHSIGGIMPFIKYYLPKAKVTPLIFKRKIAIEDLDKISLILADYLKNNPQAILIASIDFSHYLTGKESDLKDERTLALIKAWDYQKLAFLNNAYLDSPTALILLLKTMAQNKTTNLLVLNHSNSNLLLKNPKIENTSYFTMFFY